MTKTVVILWVVIIVVEVPPGDVICIAVCVVIHPVATQRDQVTGIRYAVSIARFVKG